MLCLPIIDISQTYKEDFSNQEFQFVTCKQLDDYIFNAEISQQLVIFNWKMGYDKYPFDDSLNEMSKSKF